VASAHSHSKPRWHNEIGDRRKTVTSPELDAFEEELVDRFGPLPAAAERLIGWASVRLAAKQLQVERIDAGAAAIALTPRTGFDADVRKIGLEEKNGRYLLREETSEASRLERVQTLLNALGG